MGAHHAIAEVPVDGSNDFCAYRWWRAIDHMPDNIVALIHSDDVGLHLHVIPRDSALVSHLASTTGEKHGSVQCHLITFHCDDFCSAFVGITILVIEQFRFHAACSLAYSMFIKNPLAHRRDERNSRGTTLISHAIENDA